MSWSAHSLPPGRATALPDRRVVRLVWLAAAIGMLPIVGLVAATASRGGMVGSSFDLLSELALGLGLTAFVLSGALIATRQPRNVVG
ncbi:MAG TPA: hypothetical protein VFW92_06820, partial [Candidatus Limnocylindrales bacterium]|nr:hypothetical protein [Candidatus Limnocylindrales bacterium]